MPVNLDLATGNIGWNWTVLAVLTLFSGSATVSLPSMPATVSVSETFVFTSVILFGPSARNNDGRARCSDDLLLVVSSRATCIQGSLQCLRASSDNLARFSSILRFDRSFSTAGLQNPDCLFRNRRHQGSLGLCFHGRLFFGSIAGSSLSRFPSSADFLPFKIWRENFAKLSFNYFGGASVAALLVSYTQDLDYTYLAIIVPLLMVLYFTFSTSMGRVEDANQTSYGNEHTLHVDDRDSRHGDRRQRSDHSWPHSTCSDLRNRFAAKIGC